jgi:hypothetical protein
MYKVETVYFIGFGWFAGIPHFRRGVSLGKYGVGVFFMLVSVRSVYVVFDHPVIFANEIHLTEAVLNHSAKLY